MAVANQPPAAAMITATVTAASAENQITANRINEILGRALRMGLLLCSKLQSVRHRRAFGGSLRNPANLIENEKIFQQELRNGYTVGSAFAA